MYLCVQMKVKARYIRIGAVALLTLFVAYYAILTLYAHVHEVNGTFIVHSHPFTEHHSHSSGQALTLHFLSTFTSVGSDSIESACPDLPLLCFINWQLVCISCPVFIWRWDLSTCTSRISFHLIKRETGNQLKCLFK